MKALVTGGAGFIGSHLVDTLIERGYDVVVLDNLSTGHLENVNLATKFYEMSICSPQLTDVFAAERPEFVFHQAAIPGVPQSIDNPLATHETNITGTLNVLLAARDCSAGKVLYASSSSVYGDTPAFPNNEAVPPNPQSPYAVTKVTGEYYCQVFQQVYGLATACLRYHNVYGLRQDHRSQYASVIPRFIGRLSQGLPPIISGDGEQTRDFTFVKDVVEANILAAENNASGVFNIGRGDSITINELVKLIANIMGVNIEPIHAESRTGDIRHSLADISKARSFGYYPMYKLEEGLREIIGRFQDET
ncbi:SDR family oxidoreductase [Chloroflexota bacterium]